VLDVRNLNGSILMTNVAGSIAANSVNGRVQATMTRVTAPKSMAFTTLNGNVDVTLPAATRANLKLRSDMGDVFTDFEVQVVPSGGARGRDAHVHRPRLRPQGPVTAANQTPAASVYNQES